MFRSTLVRVSLLVVTAAGAAAQQPAKSPTLPDLDGKPHQPLDLKGVKAAVLFFVIADCPVANYYSSEISAIIKEHAKQPLRFYVVHVDPDITSRAAREHARQYGLPGPILIDAKHLLVKHAGATIAPEAAVLTPDGKVAYRGRIDDVYVELGKRRVAPNRRDLREAIAAVLAGKPVAVPRTTAIGCPIPEPR